MKRCSVVLIFWGLFFIQTALPSTPQWEQLSDIERTSDGFITTGNHPSLVSEAFSPPSPAEKNFLLIEMSSSEAMNAQVWWLDSGDTYDLNRYKMFHVPAGKNFVNVLDLNPRGIFNGLQTLKLDLLATKPGVKFKIKNLQLISFSQIPPEFVSGLIFHCYTSKLHYQPGERIEYRAALKAENYPDRRSSKILDISILDEKGKKIYSAVQQYALQEIFHYKELYGVVDLPSPLMPGRYTLVATSTDQRSGLVLKATHEFRVQGPDAPFVYETPFKFVKDFTIIQDSNGLWHIFSITGDFFAGHDWLPDGHECTFSHGTSKDLRNWTYHRPVLSISNDTYPDGKGKFKDRNIWAPHIIKYDDTYYMFYTSVNKYISQSISLATSKDLFEWEDYKNNPVLTLEGLEWTSWRRNAWADCRDPMVFVDGDKFYLYVTANAAAGEPLGTVTVAESDNLMDWYNRKIALRGQPAMESPQVWKQGSNYYMTTSSGGSGTWVSDNPVCGWQQASFPRPPVQQLEHYNISPSFAEEVVQLGDGSLLMASCTFRYWGNSIYLFRIETDEAGLPIGYKSPFKLPKKFDNF